MPPDPSLHLGGSDTPPSGKTLFADLYQLTMAQAYWSSGHTADAVFSLFFRNLPPDRGYLVFAGLEDVLEHLSTFRIGPDQLSYLESLGLFDKRFLSHLAGLRFTGAVRAMPEGSIFFAEEPVVEVAAPVIEAQIVETLLLNQVHYQTLLATKASRVVHAARGRTVVDFGARRTHGMDAADASLESATWPGSPVRAICVPESGTAFRCSGRWRTPLSPPTSGRPTPSARTRKHFPTRAPSWWTPTTRSRAWRAR